MSDYAEWDRYYRDYPLEELGWELGKPRPILVEYHDKGLLPKGGRALDLCCGAGTNTVYLAQSGYDVTGIDISPTAIGIAKQKASQAGVTINFLNESFIDVSFSDGEFSFVHDMGCFHHVGVEERQKFISGVHRILQDDGSYMLTCFSYRNGAGWNHFTRQKIESLFRDFFGFGEFRHYPSLEGDGVTRFFYTVLMKKKAVA
jgi:cyclopropane fatty-acyl-phospholipid synthase-like methyltransferase